MTPLIKPTLLIKETWQTFIKTWDTTVKVSGWYMAVAVVSALAAYLKDGGPGAEFISAILQLVAAIGSIYLTVKLFKLVFSIEDHQPIATLPSRQTWKIAAQLMLSVLAIMIPFVTLVGVIAIPFVFGRNPINITVGVLLACAFIVAMFYILAVRIAFAQTRIIDKTNGVKEGFAYSWNITKGRFWGIFGRTMLGGIVFGFFIAAVAVAAILLVSAISGVDIGGEMAKQHPSPAIASIAELIQGIIMAAVMPIFYIFKVKLYRDIEKNQEIGSRT